jgi:hypothetical protein
VVRQSATAGHGASWFYWGLKKEETAKKWSLRFSLAKWIRRMNDDIDKHRQTQFQIVIVIILDKYELARRQLAPG